MNKNLIIAASLVIMTGCKSFYAHEIQTYDQATSHKLVAPDNTMTARICKAAGQDWQVLWVCESISINKNNQLTSLYGNTYKWFLPSDFKIKASLKEGVFNVSYDILGKKCDYNINYSDANNKTNTHIKTDTCTIEYINNLNP